MARATTRLAAPARGPALRRGGAARGRPGALVMALAALVLAQAPMPAAAQEDGPGRGFVVATALPATYSIAAALAEGTPITVRLVPEGGRPMGQLPELFARRAEALTAELADVDAVVTIGKLWSDDPLYTIARAANIRVVDIDATKPWSIALEGIAVAAEPVTDAPFAATRPPAERAPSIFFWLSPANGARAADIVGRDLMRLVPESAARIERNLAAFRTAMLGLQTEYQVELAELPDLTVAALAPELVYLTNAFGIYVDSYFLKQDVEWTDGDLAGLSRYLEDNAIGVVIHKWEPAERIADAVAEGGAELVVLDPIDLGIETDDGIAADSYQRLLRANLEALYSALARAQ